VVAIGIISALDGILILVTLGLMLLFFIKRESPIIKRAQFGINNKKIMGLKIRSFLRIGCVWRAFELYKYLYVDRYPKFHVCVENVFPSNRNYNYVGV
jgi:hypothetical protein